MPKQVCGVFGRCRTNRLSVATEERHDQIAAAERSSSFFARESCPTTEQDHTSTAASCPFVLSTTRPPWLDPIGQIQRDASNIRSGLSRASRGRASEPTWPLLT